MQSKRASQDHLRDTTKLSDNNKPSAGWEEIEKLGIINEDEGTITFSYNELLKALVKFPSTKEIKLSKKKGYCKHCNNALLTDWGDGVCITCARDKVLKIKDEDRVGKYTDCVGGIKKLKNSDGVKMSSTIGGQRELIRQHRKQNK